MSREQAALLQAVLQNPDDDLIRLVYADWLQENGDEDRAEFIRFQIRLAAADPADEPNRWYLKARVKELLRLHLAEWEGAIRDQIGPYYELRFERGFLGRVSVTAAEFIRHGEEWFTQHPIRTVGLCDISGECQRLAAAPHFDSIRELRFFNAPDDDLVALAEAPRPNGRVGYPNLQALKIGHKYNRDAAGSRGVSALAGCEMPRLRKLHIKAVEVDTRGAVALAAAQGFGALTSLSVQGSRIGDAGLTALLASPHRKGLTTLALEYSKVTAKGLYALADVSGGASLTTLCLKSCPIRSANVKRVGAALQNFPHLQLDLRECPIPEAKQGELVKRFGDRVLVDESKDLLYEGEW
jgi:uncharacterized protein (TIGR02996 family)